MPTLRGTSAIAFGTGSSLTVTFPTGTVAGDVGIVFVDSGWSINTPSGWTAADSAFATAGFWSGAVFYKTLTSGDISTGTVTITFSNSFDCNACMASVTLDTGAFGPGVTVKSSQNPGPTTGTSVSLTTTFSSRSTDLQLYWGSSRGNSTDTVSSGTLQRQGTNGGSASACLYSETGVTGTFSRTFSYSVGGAGNYQAIVNILTLVPFGSGGSGGGSWISVG